MTKAKFPKEVLVTRDDAGGGDTFLNCHETVDTVAEIGMTVTVAVYTLTRVTKVRTLVVIG